MKQLERELDKLIETSPADKKDAFREEMSSFAALFGRFLQEDGPSVAWNRIEKLPEGAVKDYSHLQTPTNNDQIRAMLNKLVVVKLNGGLGTSMGCHGPKSVIPVRNDLTFLDLTVQQIEVSIYILLKIIYDFTRKILFNDYLKIIKHIIKESQ